MKECIPIKKSVSNEELLAIAARCFPTYKSGISKKLDAVAVYINRNALFRVYLVVKHHKSSGVTLDIYDGVTALGSMLAFPIYGRSILKPFIQEVKAVFTKELS